MCHFIVPEGGEEGGGFAESLPTSCEMANLTIVHGEAILECGAELEKAPGLAESVADVAVDAQSLLFASRGLVVLARGGRLSRDP